MRVEHHVLPGGEHGDGPSGFFSVLVSGDRTSFLALRSFVVDHLGCAPCGSAGPQRSARRGVRDRAVAEGRPSIGRVT